MKVMIAEYHDGAVGQLSDKAKALQRTWASINQIANKPEAIACAFEPDFCKQVLQCIEAALKVADRKGRHAAGSIIRQ